MARGADIDRAGTEPGIEAEVESILEQTGRDSRDTTAVLQAIQDRYHHIPDDALRQVAARSRITLADLEGVCTFYPRFRRMPSGLHTIRVCIGTACYVKGGETIYDAFRQALRVPAGSDTDPDGIFTVEKVACLGCCMLAPVAQIGELVYGHLTRQAVPRVVRDFLAQPDPGRDPGAPSDGGDGEGVVSLCTCTSCRASGAQDLFDSLARTIDALHLPVEIRRSGCTGLSYRAPVVEVTTRAGATTLYAGATVADAPAILARHFRPRSPGARLRAAGSRLLDLLVEGPSAEPVQRLSLDLARGGDGAFWAPQVRIVTEQTGADPLDAAAYRSSGGLEALRRCAEELSPRQVIDLIRESGLRGRGGAGFPAAEKWRAVFSAGTGPRVVICNADEGDPGAFMDRLLLESFPFRVIEGMAIAAYAVGADQGLFYIRTEYPLALSRIRRALAAWQDMASEMPAGRLARVRFRVVEGAGACVCGEETAMIAAIEGRRGNPVARPPYPSEAGLQGMPTLVNNVETLATVPWIVRHGPRAFRAVGTDSSPGTKTFALAGRIVRGGLIEVPMGMSIRAIVDDIGGGVQETAAHVPGKLKAVQVGGPSGGCIPAALVDAPVDYEKLVAAGAMMGSGGMVVLDESDCMVDIARYFTEFTRRESCGKCVCCRVGSRRMHELLDGLCEGKGALRDIAILEDLALAMSEGSLCGLGRTAAKPVLSTLRHFRGEYESHAAGLCPAGRCKALISYSIGEACIGCTRCAQQCPSGAIEARPYERHAIDDSLCIRCGGCRQACPSGAVSVQPRARAARAVGDA